MGAIWSCSTSPQTAPSSSPAPPSQHAVNDVDRALLSLKTTKRKLHEQAKRVEALVNREKALARSFVAEGNKQKALLALRKRKMHQTQLAQLDDWAMNVEQVLSSMAIAQDNALVFNALKSGSTALKELQAQAPLDEVERLLEDTEDARRYQAEVADAVAVALSPEEDAAATAELMALESELLETSPTEQQAKESNAEEELPSVPTTAVTANPVADLPDVPVSEPAEAKAQPQVEEPLFAQ